MEAMNLREKLPKLLQLRGFKAAELARRTGIKPDVISKWKNEEENRSPTLVQALHLARALNVPLEYLADDQMDELPPPPVNADEMQVVDLMRALNLSKAEALRALAAWAAPPERGRPLGGGAVLQRKAPKLGGQASQATAPPTDTADRASDREVDADDERPDVSGAPPFPKRR